MLQVIAQREEPVTKGEHLKARGKEQVGSYDGHHEYDGHEEREARPVGDASVADECVSTVLCCVECEEENQRPESASPEVEVSESVFFARTATCPADEEKRCQVDDQEGRSRRPQERGKAPIRQGQA